ncbi:endonuclease [Nitrospira sp. KM1]|uniref:endonuclease/exonuclease/phosphatase family protein n=1 Tax=Nitrospira sp. KM1 TaxID=1936990 RepID=UPI0013A79DAE|nr:endonuclease/exonuclease/phosphatase family protein [Nitrospira sp. KM1]BCA54645.1 endonuclease [Nitrospira sp. KM1]
MAFTITTWNIQNYRKADPVYADKLTYLVHALKALNSDVIALQEVLDLEAVKELAAGIGFSYVAAQPDGRGNRVAFLTRNALAQEPEAIDQWMLAPGVQVRDFAANGTVEVLPKFSRPAFHITVSYGGKNIDVIAAHLKSKLLTFGGNFSTKDETLRARTAFFALERRAAEATTLRDFVTDLLKTNRNVILLGDLNDGSEAATTELLYGPPGSQPRGPEDATQVSGAFQREDAQDKQRLFNVTKFIPEAARWSRRHNGQNELLDHILVSQGLLPRVNGLRRVPTMRIDNADTPNLAGSDPNVGGVLPDHAPVTAIFA